MHMPPHLSGHIKRAAGFVSWLASFFIVAEVQSICRDNSQRSLKPIGYRDRLCLQKWITISSKRWLRQFPFSLVLNHHYQLLSLAILSATDTIETVEHNNIAQSICPISNLFLS
jgi:hypothetical protein